MKRQAWVLALSLAAVMLAGQATAPPGPAASATATTTAPAPKVAGVLKIEDADPAAAKGVGVESLDIKAEICGPLAQTTVTMVFRNNLARQLEGELEFPLPEGASVVGYALDVPIGSGILVEGVCIEKERARRVFESEERRGIDPGIVEQTRGNNYRTRVHPIPAGGTRTVQLTYASEVAGDGTYTLPLDFAGNLKSAKLRVEVAGSSKPEEIKVAGMPGMAFVQGEGAAVAEKSFANAALSGALTVTVPQKKDEIFVAVEGGYFMVSAVVPAVRRGFEVMRPERVVIVWDTSLSRAGADRTAEYAALRAMVTAAGAPFEAYGMDGKALRQGEARDVEALVTFLKELPCDGALNLDGVLEVLNTQNRKANRARGTCLLFSDGLVTMGKGVFAPDNMTVYTACSDAKADHAFLKRVAEATGGLYLNLQRMKPEEAGQLLTSPAMAASFGPTSGETTKLVLQEVSPTGPVRVVPGQRITFAGRLHANEVSATLAVNALGSTSEPAWKKEVLLKVLPGKMTGIVPRHWAQQKVAALSASGGQNDEAIVALAKQFNLVTPRTSLMVLETVDQYLRHGIVPPKSRVEISQEYARRVEEEGAQKKKAEGEKIEHILTLWKERVEWWEKEFKVPTKEQLLAEANKTSQQDLPPGGVGGGGGGGFFNGGAIGGAAGPGPSTRAQPSMPLQTPPLPPAVLGGASSQLPEDVERRRLSLVTDGTDRDATLNAQRAALVREVSRDDAAKIAIKPWSPDTPYLKAMAAAPVERVYETYLAQRKDFAASPAFYLDCGNFLLEHNQRDLGIRVLTGIAQLRLEDASLLRVAAYRLLQAKAYAEAIDLFERAKQLRPDEPQSWRDLAIAISEEALQRVWSQTEPNIAEYKRQMADLQRAMDLYNHVIMKRWDRFDEIELIALMEANALWEKIQRLPGYEMISRQRSILNPLDSRLVKNLDCDVRVVMTWDADVTDIDLHVIEPTGQEAFYEYNRTLAGGLVSADFTQGYGPEEYLIHRAVPGTYKIAANFYGSQQQSLQGPVTVQATVITNFGRANEKRQAMTLRLTEQKETVPIGEVTIGK